MLNCSVSMLGCKETSYCGIITTYLLRNKHSNQVVSSKLKTNLNQKELRSQSALYQLDYGLTQS